MGQDALRVAVGGLHFGADVHVAAFRDLPKVEVVALLGRDINQARAEAERLGIAHARTSIEELLDLDVDLITLALPPSESAHVAEEVLQAQVPLFCEKPLAAELAPAQHLVELAGTTPQAMDFQFAELPAFQELRRQVQSERFGPPVAVRIEWFTQSYAQKHRHWCWKTDEALGGGVLSLNGSHLLYLCEWLFGPCQTIEAQLSSTRTASFAPAQARPGDDCARIKLAHRRVNVDIELDNARVGSHLHRWTVTCEGATLVLENSGSDYMAGFSLVVRTPSGTKVLLDSSYQPAADGRIPPCQAIAKRFVEQVRGGPLCSPNLKTGLRVQQLINAARESSNQGEGVTVFY